MNPIRQLCERRQLRLRVEACRPRLYRLAWSWCRDAQLADDLTQEALLKGLHGLDRLHDGERLEAWLIRILVNLHNDHLRRRRDEVELAEETLVAEEGPEQTVHRASQVERVRAAIARLSDDQRKVLTLVDISELSYAEVAGALEIPIGTVMSRLCRARSRLKVLLADEGRVAEGATVTKLRSVR